MNNRPIKTALGVLALSLIPFLSNAHVPFLKPNQFHVLHNRFQIESAFTEFPFQADFAMDVPTFSMITPDGAVVPLTPSAKTKAAVYLEPEISGEGTYRFTTGVRKGPKYSAIETADGKLYFAEDTLRVQGQKTFLQYYNSAETYVVKGHDHYHPVYLNKGVEIVPLTSPNELLLGEQLSLRILRDGKPVPNARMVVAYDNEHYEKYRVEDLYDVENVRESNLYADSEGIITFAPKRAGLVLLFVTVHEKINPLLWESHNTSLSLEVLTEEHEHSHHH